MNFKRIVTYLFAGMSMSMNSNNATSQNVFAQAESCNHAATVIINTTTKDLLALAKTVDFHFFDIYNISTCLDLKAESLCNAYRNNMLGAQQRLAPYVGKHGYRAAVRKELPGAPVGLHCVYGQYTQLQRALNEIGDTLTIVPPHASRACATFKSQMRRMYTHANGYDNCIFEGKMYESDSVYNAAKNAYLARNHATSDDAFVQYTQKFNRNNFSIESIEPGAMLIVPRTRGNTRKFHMIMYVGRGYIKNGQYVPDASGRHVFTAHNSERIGYLFDAWDTNNVFAANIQQIARARYARELSDIESMPRQKLIEYILAGNCDVNVEHLNKMPLKMLQKIARDIYFKAQIPHTRLNNLHIIARNNVRNPLNMMMQRNIAHTL